MKKSIYLIITLIIVFNFLVSCKSKDDKSVNKITVTKTKVENPEQRIKVIYKQTVGSGYWAYILDIDGHQYLSRLYNGGFALHLESCEKCLNKEAMQQLNKQKIITEILVKQKDILKDMLYDEDYEKLVERLRDEF